MLLEGSPITVVQYLGYSESDCGYCKSQNSSRKFALWAHSLTPTHYQKLMDRGWRRSGKYIYKPDITESCCPQYTIRLEGRAFTPSKEQKRVWSRLNKFILGSTPKARSGSGFDLIEAVHSSELDKNAKHKFEVKLTSADFTIEKFELFSIYQRVVHKESDEDISPQGFKRFLCQKLESADPLKFGSFHQEYRVDGKLIGLAVLDLLPGGVSSVYFVYDPEYSKLSLGKVSALREIALVIERGYEYYYMGYYIPQCPKMRYKGEYKPSKLLDPVNYSWHDLDQFPSRFNSSKSFSIQTFNMLGVTPIDELNFDISEMKVLVDCFVFPAKDFILFGDIRGQLEEIACCVGEELARDIIVAIPN